ncbi:MAG: thiamine pyrophosphate-binding protein [Phycisphaerae bacterium]|nr:thiamine pyrophosphate-binding protein [Phycisphaerae bacterium]
MRVADFIFKFLSDKGVDAAFMVSGGQAMFLVDALYQNRNIDTICTHHEQAAGMSADAYGRYKGPIGVALVTAGPGGINVLNGVVGGWTDSSPMMIISGQSALSHVQYQENTGIRQSGIQGINIKPMVKCVTKYFVTVDDPNKILYYMQKAYHLATTGRPGPVWIDVPIDIQKMEVSNKLLEEYCPSTENSEIFQNEDHIEEVLKLLESSQRPLFLAGQGIRLADAVEKFNDIINKLKMPIITSRLGIDLIHSDSELYVGRPGIYGERSANFAIQNADLLIAVGCRLASALIGYNPKDFARNAKIAIVDIDMKELEKPIAERALKIRCDAKVFLKNLLSRLDEVDIANYDKWIKKCNEWKEKYPVVLPSYKDEKPVNSYYFTDKLSQAASCDDAIVVDTGSCFHVACQTWKIKKGQRFLTTGGISTMGYWPAAIGACVANKKQRTIVITGDGSLQMNIQEFATIKHYNLPIKVIIFNNNGYLLIRHTQKNFMEGRLFGEGPATGVWCPDSLRIAEAYGIKGVRIESSDEVEAKIKEVMSWNGPVICDVMTPEWQLIIPRVSSEKKSDGTLVSSAYEDMYPFLDRGEFRSEMIIEPLD